MGTLNEKTAPPDKIVIVLIAAVILLMMAIAVCIFTVIFLITNDPDWLAEIFN